MNRQDVSLERLRRLAARWHDPTTGGSTYCLPPGHDVPSDVPLPEDIVATMRAGETGSILFWSLGEAHLVLPPFAVERAAVYQGWHSGPLQSLLDRARCVLVLLLRLGSYAVGIYEKGRLVQSKTGTRFVKGRHRKGGSSSTRFARRREEQARALFDKACEVLHEQVEAYPGRLDHLLLGGDRLTLLAFEKRCSYLRSLDSLRLRRTLEVREPSLRALRDLPRLMYMSSVTTFKPEITPFGPRDSVTGDP